MQGQNNLKGEAKNAMLYAALDVWREYGKNTCLRLSGNSMWPLIRHGCDVLIDYNPHKVGIGDVIVFKHLNRTIAHRIVRVQTHKDAKLFTTKGDCSPRFDPIIPENLVIGKVISINRRGWKINSEAWSWRVINKAIALCSYMYGIMFSKKCQVCIKIKSALSKLYSLCRLQ